MGGHVLRLGGRDLEGHDAGHPAQAADESRAEPEVRGARIVVDAERQPALARDGGEMLEYLVVGQRRVGHRGEQTGGGAGRFGVLREQHGLVRPQSPHADKDRNLSRRLRKGGVQSAPAFGSRKVRVGAGAAEQADRVDARRTEWRDESAQGGDVDLSARAGRRDGKGG